MPPVGTLLFPQVPGLPQLLFCSPSVVVVPRVVVASPSLLPVTSWSPFVVIVVACEASASHIVVVKASLVVVKASLVVVVE